MLHYDAFISYSHAKDKPIAAALQSVIQTLGKPWYRRRAVRIFRDDTSLSATPHLWPSIEAALDQSRYFILLASPEAAASRWVNKEVAHWLGRNSADRLLIANTDGALIWNEEAGDFDSQGCMPLPPVLAGKFVSEPKWVDLRGFRDAVNKHNARFADLAADFAAAIRGLPKEDLLSEEVRQQRRTLTLAYSGVATLAVLIVVAGWQWKIAVDNEHQATEQKRIAEQQREVAKTESARAERNFGAAKSTIDAVIFDLVQGLKDVEGMSAETARRILGQAEASIGQLVSSTEQDPALQRSQATMFRLFSELTMTLGATETAIDYAQKAIAIERALLAANPADAESQYQLTNGLQRLADASIARNELAQALAAIRECLDIDRAVIAKDPNLARWQYSLSANLNRLGVLRKAQGDYAAALAAFRESLEIRRMLASRFPDVPDLQRDFSIGLENVAGVLAHQRDLAGALAAYQESLAIRRAIAARDPGNTQWRRDVSLGLEGVGYMLADQGDVTGALAAFRESLDIIRQLTAKDPGNTRWQRDLSVTLDNVGDLLRENGDSEQALRMYREASDIFRRLVAKDPNVSSWQSDLSVNLEKIGEVLTIQGDPKAALTAFEESLAVRRGLAAKGPSRPDWQRDVALSLVKIGDLLSPSGEKDRVRAAYRESLAISRVLASQDPTNSIWQRDLSVVLDRVGDIMLAQSSSMDAESLFRESLAIRRTLADKEPGNIRYRRDIAVSLNKVGDVLLARSDLSNALLSYQEGLQIIRILAAKYPKDAGWQVDLQYSAGKIGVLAYDFVLARNFEQALGLSDEAIAAAPDMLWLHSNRAHALMFLNRVDEARALYLRYRGTRIIEGEKSWESVILDDFAGLRKAGLRHPLMDEIKKKFTLSG